MSDEPAETFSADAVRWIDGLSDPSGLRGSWRLQMLEHRVTVKETGVDPETGVKTYSREMRPVRLVRFAKGCPWALVPEAERYLLSLAPYAGKIVNGVDIPGTYKPTRTRWIRDDQTNLDDPRRSTNENRHTLVQDLVEASAADGDSVPQSSDCVETVVAEYHWDEPSLPEAGDLPAASQGVTVSVQQVSRQEDGTYRYAIVTRTAKTRVGAEATVECTAFQSVVQQDFTNLYGDPGTGFEDEAGNEVDVPSQTCGTGGVNVEWRNLRQNDDCTWNVSVVMTAGTAVSDVERTSSETTVERRDTRKDAAQAGPLQHVKVQDPATSTAEGHVWEQRSELRPDGLYDNTVTKRDEKQLAGQVVEKRRTIRGTTVRTVNRNMPSAAADPSGIGAVVNTVTDSGRVTQEITEVDRNAQPVDAGSACSTTVFEHVESDRTIQPTKPAKHWQDAGGGHRYERTSRITEEGSYEVTAEDRQELQRTNAKVTLRKTLRGTQRTVVDRNVASPLAETGLVVGETRDSEVTPGGLYVTTKTVTTAEAAGTVGTECQKTIFEHTDSTTSNQAAQPSAEADEAGNGRTRRKSARQTEEGTWDVVTVTTEEKTQQAATKSWRKTLRGTQETTVDRNAVAALNGTGLKVGETRSSEKTPGGRYNNTTVTVTANAAGTVGTECQKTVFEHVDSTTTNVADKPAAEADEAGSGTVRRKTARETEEGTWDVTVQTTTEKPQANATRTWRKTLRGTQATVVDRNASAALNGSGLSVGETRSSELTPGGLYNNTTVTVTADVAGEIGSECRQTVFEHVDSTTENQQNAPTGHATSAGDGKTYQRTARQTEEGTWDVVTVTTEEKTQQAATKSWRKTLRGSTVTTVTRNASAPLTGVGLQLGETQTSEMTPGGRYNNTEVKVSPDIVGTVATSCEWSELRHTHSTTVNQQYKGNEEASSASGNTVSRVVNRATDEGSWDVTTETTTHQSRSVTATSNFETETSVTTVVVNNTNGSPLASCGTATGSVNEHGTYTTSVTEYTPKPVDSGWITWNSTVEGPHYRYHYANGVRVFKNQSSVPQPPSGKNGHISAGVNRYGLYDGTLSYSSLTSWTENSGGGSEEHGSAEGTIRVKYVKLVDNGSQAPEVQTATADLSVRHYFGRVEGGERSMIVNMKTCPGLTLPSRTYLRSDPPDDFVKAMEQNRIVQTKFARRMRIGET